MIETNDPKKNKIKKIQRRILAGVVFSCTAMMILYIILYLANEGKNKTGHNQNSENITSGFSILQNKSGLQSGLAGDSEHYSDLGNGSDTKSGGDTGSKPDTKIGKSTTDSGGKNVSAPDGKSTANGNGEYIQLVIEPEKTGKTISTTVSFFKKQIPILADSLKNCGFYYSERLLDQETGTKAYIVALDDNCAQNLNGYFYYLFDEKSTATIVSPFVLNISLLFEEKNRKTAVQNGTYSDPPLVDALEESLKAALGKYYSPEVSRFIETEYRKNFSSRMSGEATQNPVCKLKAGNLEVIFHNSFLTYVEFFINP